MDNKLEPVVHDDSVQAPKVYLEFKNVSYTVPIKNKQTNLIENKQLLHDNCGYVRPGEVIALMQGRVHY